MTTTVTKDLDRSRLRKYRLARVQAELRRASCGGCLLLDPINRRYATDASLHPLFQMHLPSRYAFVPAEGKAILFQGMEPRKGEELSETVSEVRPPAIYTYFYAGRRVEERARQWAQQVRDLLREFAFGERRVAVDRLEPVGMAALMAEGLEVISAQELMERARLIKSADEIVCMSASITAAEAGIADMRAALKPGMTENELFSLLHRRNIACGGEWIEGRLLGSGSNANPWGHECNDKVIQAGELVAFDTDMIGPFGYCADVSRTFLCPPQKPTSEQRRLYKLAIEQLEFNMALVRPGLSYREFAEKAWRIPGEFLKNRYGVVAHGIGMADEYPAIAHAMDWAESGEDGIIQENTTLCVESYMGTEGGGQGVKIEEQILVTSTGYRKLTSFPLEHDLRA